MGRGAVVSGWRPDGTGITLSGDSRADDQASDFCVVRFRHPDYPSALVTCKSYAYTGVPAVPGRFYVATDVERLTCTDPVRPGETCTWHDIERDYEHDTWPTAAEAQGAARDTAEAWLRSAAPAGWTASRTSRPPPATRQHGGRARGPVPRLRFPGDGTPARAPGSR